MGPKWRSGHRSGAVKVCPGGTLLGSIPSGNLLVCLSEGMEAESKKPWLRADDCEGPALGEVLPVHGPSDLGRIAQARSQRVMGDQRPLGIAELVAAGSQWIAGDFLPVRAQEASRIDRQLL